MSENVDIVVIGAGPAGLAAARAAAKADTRVLLLDEQPAPGGQVWRAVGRRLADPDAALRAGDSDAGAAEALAGLDHPAIDYVRGATVVDATPELRVTWLGPPTTSRPRLRETQARAIVIATGALERPVPFPGWTLPGVMGVGALQLLLKQDVVPEGRIVLAGQGPLVLLTLAQLRRAGARVTALLDFGPTLPPLRALGRVSGAVADPATFAKGAALAAARTLSGIPLFRSVRDLVASGETAVGQVKFESRGTVRSIGCDLLAVHDGIIANTQLTRLLGLPHDWSADHAAFVPRTEEDGRAAPGIWVAGDGAGIGGAEIARLTGELSGYAAASSLGALHGRNDPAAALRAGLRRLRRARALIDAIYPALPLSAHMTNTTPICRCEAITAEEVGAAVRAGAIGPNRVKTYTRAGMGPCQGRMCGNALTRLIADTTGSDPADVGALRIRPPLKPVLVGDYLPADQDG